MSLQNSDAAVQIRLSPPSYKEGDLSDAKLLESPDLNCILTVRIWYRWYRVYLFLKQEEWTISPWIALLHSPAFTSYSAEPRHRSSYRSGSNTSGTSVGSLALAADALKVYGAFNRSTALFVSDFCIFICPILFTCKLMKKKTRVRKPPSKNRHRCVDKKTEIGYNIPD